MLFQSGISPAQGLFFLLHSISHPLLTADIACPIGPDIASKLTVFTAYFTLNPD